MLGDSNITMNQATKRGEVVPLTIEIDQENDGRWLAEVPELPGVMTYGQTRQEAIERVQVLSLRVLADRLDHGEPVPQMSSAFAVLPNIQA
jgi:predicted RNase H-like HicB family nuclease